ncbi:OmpW family protein [Azonexus sp.]|uniref:OmpW/AlkL family protein n=1 Tax=Azonexus sp. TaxID=1872668 RepID=UPI0035AFAF1F
MHKKLLVAALAAVGLVSSAAAETMDYGPFMVRVRAVNIAWENGNSAQLKQTTHDLVGAGDVQAQDKVIPEIDLSYFFTPNIAAELVLTHPQVVDVQAVGGGSLGKVRALPPSLMLQYHFTDFGAFKPYVGLGVNYTYFNKNKGLRVPTTPSATLVEVDRTSFGLAAQIGADFALDKNFYLNVDVKYIQMSTDVKVSANGQKVGKLDLNPITAGVGVGYRF